MVIRFWHEPRKVTIKVKIVSDNDEQVITETLQCLQWLGNTYIHLFTTIQTES